jgi:hypothetical protein
VIDATTIQLVANCLDWAAKGGGERSLKWRRKNPRLLRSVFLGSFSSTRFTQRLFLSSSPSVFFAS